MTTAPNASTAPTPGTGPNPGPAPITLAVHGDATIHHPAERGTVRVVVGFRGKDRQTIVRSTTVVHEQIVAAAKAHEQRGAATWWSADQVSFSSYQDYQKDVPVARFRAGASVEVKFRDFRALADWVLEIGGIDGVAVQVTWALTESRRVELERRARVDAVRDALTRATDYAASLDRPAPRLVAVYEPGLRPDVVASGGGSPMSARMMASPSGGDAAFELKPADIEVTASVTADFVV
ncbi:SIMPL domain-containing protein [Curtobacterium sp. Leaf261]|uniref:SIMPL domain-containing protein n=1 Tax=Curtobacterium sp. Leaf261 TaxID=1736311 RepID=UPI0006F8B08C|nr:SIMPL domain-containing protein [Curtobacterium sp. Leaf261]KQO62388.1 hypothetical protein ASF23_11465 [Curtobacterium sp. Leaf261]